MPGLPPDPDSPPMPLITSSPATATLPRILCLHGAGVNANVFAMQMRGLLPALSQRFRLVFVDGPYDSEMHPALAPVYVDLGPYARWSAWQEHHDANGFPAAVAELEARLTATMRADTESNGASGPWVGVLGFSQGAKLAASMLLENQLRRARGVDVGFAGAWWEFGVLLAGRALPFALDRETEGDPFYTIPGELYAGSHYTEDTKGFADRLKTPTLHVHGLQDPGLAQHRQLRDDFCVPASTVLVEWDDGHRLPYKRADCDAVVNGVFRVAKMAGLV